VAALLIIAGQHKVIRLHIKWVNDVDGWWGKRVQLLCTRQTQIKQEGVRLQRAVMMMTMMMRSRSEKGSKTKYINSAVYLPP